MLMKFTRWTLVPYSSGTIVGRFVPLWLYIQIASCVRFIFVVDGETHRWILFIVSVREREGAGYLFTSSTLQRERSGQKVNRYPLHEILRWGCGKLEL